MKRPSMIVARASRECSYKTIMPEKKERSRRDCERECQSCGTHAASQVLRINPGPLIHFHSSRSTIHVLCYCHY